jgi:disulfide bond formation protein DsbB
MRLARPQIALACFVVGALLVLLVEAAIARIVGVPLMLTGILLGVAAIATPEFLAGDRKANPDRDMR